MGKKNRKKQDDGDYFASLGAPTENAVDDAAAEKAEEERLARQAKAAAQREAKKQKEAQERAERAAVAERARLAMERRNNKGKAVAVEEAEEEEAVEEPAPAPQPTAAEEAAPPPPPLSSFARVLLFLRPFSPDAGAVSGVGKVWRFLWVLLATFASPATIEDVDAHLRTSNSEAAERDRRRGRAQTDDHVILPGHGQVVPAEHEGLVLGFAAADGHADRTVGQEPQDQGEKRAVDARPRRRRLGLVPVEARRRRRGSR